MDEGESERTKETRRTWLLEARKRLGLSQTELAGRAGCSQNQLSKIETGVRQRIDRQLAEALGRELQMTREQVMYGDCPAGTVRIRGVIFGDEIISKHSAEELLEINWLAEKELEGYRIAVD